MDLIELLQWEPGIYQLEQTDLVLAGKGGIANEQARLLANRTAWLKSELYKLSQFKDVKSLQGDTVLDETKAGYLFTLYKPTALNTSLNVTLPDITDCNNGDILAFSAFAVNGIPAALVPIAGQNIILGEPKARVYVHANEAIMLVADKPNKIWQVVSFSGNFLEVGNPIYGYKIQANTVVRNGGLLSRAYYPRLWEWVQTLQPETLVTDIIWNSGIDYMGTFSRGDGATNFRVPDDRAMFDRALDLGRGIDLDRRYNFPGGHEKDEIIKHSHEFETDGDNKLDNNPVNGYPHGRQNPDNWRQKYKTLETGGRETRPMNTGKIPLLTF